MANRHSPTSPAVPRAAGTAAAPLPDIALDVLDGLLRQRKRLPPYLFYDEQGSRLYERITRLPEYYPTRTERWIFERHADAIVDAVAEGAASVSVLELGAGSATKTQLLLHAIARRQGHCTYFPVDVSLPALEQAAARLSVEEPSVDVVPMRAMHREAFGAIGRMPGGEQQVVLFVGSSIGNFTTREAVAFLRHVSGNLREGGRLVLGTDLVKSPTILIPAYDDAARVTAAFNKNLLARINRELGGEFDADLFRHVALWNARVSRIELHLESVRAQAVRVRRLGIEVRLAEGERIHTESSVKYTVPRVERLLRRGGFVLERTFTDDRCWFAVHVARRATAVTAAVDESRK